MLNELGFNRMIAYIHMFLIKKTPEEKQNKNTGIIYGGVSKNNNNSLNLTNGTKTAENPRKRAGSFCVTNPGSMLPERPKKRD